MKGNGPTSRPLTTLEAAKRLGVSKGFLEKLRMTGGGPRFLKIGHKVLYEPDALEQWLSAKRMDRTPPVTRNMGRQNAKASPEHPSL